MVSVIAMPGARAKGCTRYPAQNSSRPSTNSPVATTAAASEGCGRVATRAARAGTKMADCSTLLASTRWATRWLRDSGSSIGLKAWVRPRIAITPQTMPNSTSAGQTASRAHSASRAPGALTPIGGATSDSSRTNSSTVTAADAPFSRRARRTRELRLWGVCRRKPVSGLASDIRAGLRQRPGFDKGPAPSHLERTEPCSFDQ
ncbi:hypothetical protein [Azospirillum endophyticum]